MADLPEGGLPEDLPPADFEQLVEQLKKEETHAQEARLGSVESLRLWVSEHPGLQQPTLMETLAVYGPVLLEFLRRAMGF